MKLSPPSVRSSPRRTPPCIVLVLALALVSSSGCVQLHRRNGMNARAALLRTRAERSGYTETSTYADVVGFIDSLRSAGAPIEVGSIGRTAAGRDIPYVIASRPLVRTPLDARRLGRPIVYIQGNIHAGEVEGKDALLALMRDLVANPAPNALDSIVLIAVPIYNADGNEVFASQSVNRTEQNGPERVGQRANAQGLDLNRDYVKAEAPETRASLAMFTTWNPDVFVDLHTTDGSFHGYALTYAPSLSPAAPLGEFTRDHLLPVIRRRMHERDRLETFDYGDFVSQDSVERGWFTFDNRPRFGTNYVGIRGKIAILSEAYSHDPFERRVRSTYAFVSEILSLVASQAQNIVNLTHAADSASIARLSLPVRSVLTDRPERREISYEEMERTTDSAHTQPGVPAGLRRTGRFRTRTIPMYTWFMPQIFVRPPAAYALPPGDTAAVRLLRAHGIVVAQGGGVATGTHVFTVDSIVRNERLFQGHHEVRLSGHWRDDRRVLPANSWIVSTSQPLGRLVVYLLEPESDDGLTTWNVFDSTLTVGGEFPVLRLDEVVTSTPGGGH